MPQKAPQLRSTGGKRIEHTEESLAPIMPGRFAKWIIPIVLIISIVVLAVLARTVYYIVTLEPEPDIMEVAKNKPDARTDAGHGGADVEEDTGAGAAEPGSDSQDEGAPTDAATTSEVPATADDATGMQGETVEVKLKVIPPEAIVKLDGVVVAPPYEWKVAKDGATHSYEVSAPWYETVETKFVSDRDRKLEVNLTKSPQVTITLDGVPDGAQVTLDGKPAQPPFVWTFEPSKQPHSYRVIAEGYEKYEGAFIPDKDKLVSPKLESTSDAGTTAPPEPTPPPTIKPEKKPTKKPGKPGKQKEPGGGFVDEVPF